MSWRRLELWATIAFGLAAGLALFLLSVKTWSPEDWWARRLVPGEVVGFLIELGDLSSGLIVIIFLLILGVSVTMTVLLRGFEKLAEIREERRRLRAEGRAEGRAEITEEWEAWVAELVEEGKLPPDVRLPSSQNE